MVINVDESVHFKTLNDKVRECGESDITINGCLGQRYICDGLSGKRIVINGTPGNALGAYLNGCEVIVHGNAQDATGDTMNSGRIIIYGNAGDATGYAMRGGRIYIKGNTGYRAGIHMKAYMDFKPVIVVGGRAGSFLGEYQAGGIIVVLGQNNDGLPIINNFCGTGMHGGKIYLRCDELEKALPKQVSAERKWGGDIPELCDIVKDYCNYFTGFNYERLINANFFVLEPNSANPYKQMYTDN
ncbi:MAG: glutamate synthase [Clostridia bacterium]|nr:glutamate synthase [Clostridia bacterium]